uniref:NADH-ubiquinone oxidoreductase chain 4L n=1 Tax=Apolygus lucorum TaxID=248454 RepID=V5IVA4_APOLU|nr:NADH dehydrogenase subunit 4L [Apolygus lucorum]ADZ52282.1 NADH dehydrogenase subunit 4L [Apolygus lucorum]ANT45819.1 NADH dehydrogenase subunit 4L [Apolygus lucorum]
MLMYFMYNMYYMLFFMFLSGLVVFCSMRKHILLSLLSLEYIVLCIYIFMIMYMINNLGDMYLVLVFLTFSVCEGVLGLSILVTIIRSYGNDQVNSLFMMKW